MHGHRSPSRSWALVAALAASAAFVSQAAAQSAPIAQKLEPARVDSGAVVASGKAPKTVFMAAIESRGAPWVRLKFDEVSLAGHAAQGNGAFLRITSLLDGAQQTLDAVHAGHWGNTSAYFNGDTVVLELIAYPGTGPSRVRLSEFWAGIAEPGSPDSLCGIDDRVLSSDPRVARLMPIGCTAWLVNNAAKCFITAGHCISTSTSNAVVQFNVPLSTSSGSPVNPPPQHQYPVQQLSIQSTGSGGTGNDAAYFGALPNSQTNLTAFQAQGQAFNLAPAAPPVQGQGIRITGHGSVSSPVSPTWNLVQKTHVGPYFSKTGTRLQYQTDTTGGNSGSPVIDETTGLSIGVHTHGGCGANSGNSGTAVEHAGLQSFLNNPRGVCIPPPPPSCYADCNGDQVLNLADFGCFQTRFAQSDPYADCNGDGQLNLADFGCFQTKFALGCP